MVLKLFFSNLQYKRGEGGNTWKEDDTVKQKVIFEEGVTAKVEKEYDHKRLKIACTK